MNKTLLWLAGVLMVIAGLSLAGYWRDPTPTPPPVGSTAPDLTLMNQDGKPVSLKDYRGQWVVLYFYPRDFGQLGTTGVRSFKRDLRKYEELHTVVLGISRSGVSSHKAFADQEQLPFPLLSDEGLRVAKQYGSAHRTHLVFYSVAYGTFIIDPTGKVARVFYGFDAVDPSGPVLNAVNALRHQ